jgi:hypothetical protein
MPEPKTVIAGAAHHPRKLVYNGRKGDHDTWLVYTVVGDEWVLQGIEFLSYPAGVAAAADTTVNKARKLLKQRKPDPERATVPTLW